MNNTIYQWTNARSPEEYMEIILSRIADARAVVAPQYDDYIACLHGIATDFGERGRDYAHRAFQFYPSYDSATLDKHYDNVLSGNRQEVNIGTFYWHCKQAGVDIKVEYDDARAVRRRGRPSMAKTTDGEPAAKRHRASVEQIMAFLGTQLESHFNQMNGFTEVCMKDGSTNGIFVRITDEIVNTIACRMDREMNLVVYPSDVYKVLQSEYSVKFHPVLAFLSTCKPWTEGDRDHIADLASTVSVEGDADMWVVRVKKKLVSLLASVVHGKADHTILTLVSDRQGIYKTTWVQYLLPPCLRDYFYNKTNGPHFSKDEMLMMCQYLIINLDEVTGYGGAALRSLKGIVTTPAVDQRPAYGHFVVHHRRICSFTATGNNSAFLDDPSGNRRWLPVTVRSVDSDAIQQLDYEAIYGQALYLLEHGFQYWYDQEEIAVLNEQNKAYEVPDLTAELIGNYFSLPDETHPGVWMNNASIIEVLLPHTKQTIEPQQLGYAMRKLGFERRRRKGSNGYLVHIFDGQEINERKNMPADVDESVEPF